MYYRVSAGTAWPRRKHACSIDPGVQINIKLQAKHVTSAETCSGTYMDRHGDGVLYGIILSRSVFYTFISITKTGRVSLRTSTADGVHAMDRNRRVTRASSLLCKLSGSRLVGSEGRDMAVMDDLGVELGLGGVSGTVGVADVGAVPLGVPKEEPACGFVSLSGSAAKHL